MESPGGNADILMQNLNLLPFNRTVSKYYIKDNMELDIATTSRKVIDVKIRRLIETVATDGINRFLPIIGAAGTGKSHYYWVLKALENQNSFIGNKQFKVVYISSPPSPERIFHHIYTCLVSELGNEQFFNKIADGILDEIGIRKKNLRSKTNLTSVIFGITEKYPKVFADPLKALVYLKSYGSKKSLGSLAFRWLMGESLSVSYLNELQIGSNLERNDSCLAIFKIISYFSGNVLTFYFDELETPFRTFSSAQYNKMLTCIKQMFRELRNSVIIIACLKEIWGKIISLTETSFLNNLEMELHLENFTLEDFKVYYIRAINHFWQSIGEKTPKNLYYPLSEKYLEKIYSGSLGNQREVIKKLNTEIESQLMRFQQNNSNLEYNKYFKSATYSY
jgi:hypothetical protein